ncbi:MAG: methionyl-tRNA formyltransferase [Oscillospiraceae bacterium]|nr:methionyl-tRNA formyltransferase [Oscillospiraceae bacterium]
MRVVLVGSVASSERLLKVMIEKNIEIAMVFSLDEQYSENVSGYRPIHNLAQENNIPYTKFKKINDAENVEIIKNIKPDYIFIVGLSQLVKKEIISCAKKGVVGYHPTPLPKFRGRAATVWQILLGVKKSAVSMFFIDEGIDSGDIICQEEYEIAENDYPTDVGKKTERASLKLFAKALDLLQDPDFKPTPQNEEEATYLLKRTPEDGKINWNEPGEDIARLIRATSRPYPGAFASYEGKSDVIFWRSDFIPENKYIGFFGQIISVDDEKIDILCKNGILRVTDYTLPADIKLIAGHKFK